MRSVFFRVSVLCVALVGSWPALPQQKTEALPDASANSSGHQLNLDVVVTPKSGDPVGGLGQADFKVFDNKVERPITSFAAVSGPEAPVEVILLIDAVNTGFDNVAFERGEIDKFLAGEGVQLAHPLTLAVLTDTGIQIQPQGSRDVGDLKAELDQYTVALRSIRRSAGFYGAEDRLTISLQALGRLISREGQQPGRKVILWVSPGWPLVSGPEVELTTKERNQLFAEIQSLSTSLRQARITISSIDPLGSSEDPRRSQYYRVFLNGITKAGNVDEGDIALQVLATQSGGLALTGNNDISSLLRRAWADSLSYYEVGFESAPGNHPGEYHRVDVKVDKPGLVARTRTGYYTGP